MVKARLLRVTIALIVVAVLVGSLVLYVDVWGTKRDLRIRYDFGRTLFSAGQYEKALEVFRSIEERAPRYVNISGEDASFYVAAIHRNRGDIEEARRVYRMSIEKGLTAASYLPLASMEIGAGNYREAVRLLEEALTRKAIQRDRPDSGLAHEGLFYGYASLHERDRALEHFAACYEAFLELKDTFIPGLGTGQDFALLNLYAYSRTPPGGVKAPWRQWIEGDPEYQRLLEHYKQAFQYYEHEQELIDVLGSGE